MRVEQVDFTYLAIDNIRDVGDGSQDALLVKVTLSDGSVGYGECEAAPLPSIAAWCCPMSHSACHPLRDIVLGAQIDTPADIFALTDAVRTRCFDLLQADHTLSGIDIALWDALGKHCGEPVWKLLGYQKSFPKIPYASQLFGDTPEETYHKAKKCKKAGFLAAKFGWGPFGRDLKADNAHIHAARRGLGDNVQLLVDAGTYWVNDVRAAAQRAAALLECRVGWLEEPFRSSALKSYAALAEHCPGIPLAAGEGSHEPEMACNMLDFAKLQYVQIDTGRIGGITSAYKVAEYLSGKNAKYVNHTFTTPLALAASLQPFAGLRESELCEYPTEASELAVAFVKNPLKRDADGLLRLSEAPGLGVEVDTVALKRFQRHVTIICDGKTIWEN